MPGPVPKPASQRQRRNKRPNDVGLIPSISSDVEIPKPNRAWLKSTTDEWESYWQCDVSNLVVRGAEMSAVKRLFDYRDEHARSLRAYRESRLAQGSAKQIKLSPHFAAMQALERLIVPLEDRFGLSSMARLRLGAELGTATKSLAEMNAELDAKAADEDDDHIDEYQEGEVIDLPGLPHSG